MSTDPVAVDITSNQQTREMIMAKKIIVSRPKSFEHMLGNSFSV
jgi:hypothetical protein